MFAVALIAVACYVPFLRGPFLSDDLAIIVANPAVRQLGSPLRLLSPGYWREHHPGTKGLYRPIRETLFGLVYAGAGPSPVAFHSVNLALHAGTTIMVYMLARAVLGAAWPALLAGLFFAVHPLHAEPVIWAKNAGDLLCAFFALLSAYLCVGYDRRAGGGRRSALWLAGACAAFAAALLSKESAITLPLLLFVYFAFQRPGRGLRKAVLRTAPLWAVAALYLAVIVAPLFVGEAPVFGAARSIKVSVPLRLAMFAKTVTFYHRLLLFPVPLNALHQFDHPHSLADPGVVRDMVLCVAFAAATILAAVYWRRGRLAVLWAGISLAPSYNLIPYSGRPVGENRLYFPSVGVCLLLGLMVGRVVERPRSAAARAGRILAVALLVVFAWMLVDRGQVWQTRRAFWRDAARKAPGWSEGFEELGQLAWDSGHARAGVALLERAAALCDASVPPWTHAVYRYSLATAYARMGRQAEARREYAKATRLDPRRPDLRFHVVEALRDAQGVKEVRRDLAAWLKKRTQWVEGWVLLGRCMLMTGEVEEAVGVLARAAGIAPREVTPRLFLGQAQLRLGRSPEAVATLSQATKLGPHLAYAWERLGTAHLSMARFGEAERCFRRARRLAPGLVSATTGLGVTLLEQRRPDDAARVLADAAEMAPWDPRTVGAYGAALMAAGRHGSAIPPLERAAKLAPPGEPRAQSVWRNLVECHVRLGQFGRAVRWQEMLVKHRPGDAEAKARLQWLRSRPGGVP